MPSAFDGYLPNGGDDYDGDQSGTHAGRRHKDNRVARQPEYDALNKFDAENNVEPPRVIAYRIAAKYGHSERGRLVDEIAHAIEDAMELGQKRGKLIPPTQR